MTTKPFEFTKEFVRERCDFCGRCFAECPVLQMPQEKAQEEFRAFADTGSSPALDLCTGCMACNTICPQDANPHTLIMRAWGERYRERGMPPSAHLVLPYEKRNLHRIAQGLMPEDERALLRQWEANWRNPPECDVMMYAGCNMMLLPFVLDSSIYGDLPIFGGLDLCCGEPFYRMGCWEAAKAAANNVRGEFQRMRLKKIVVPCLACYQLFNHVYPDMLDVSLGVEVITIEDWLSERIAAGALRLSPLNKTVALHDNCWPKASGDVIFDKVRELLAHIGVTVEEAEHYREHALCCGMCAAAARYRLRDIMSTAKRLLKELDNTPGEWSVEYCGGCAWLLSLINQTLLSKYTRPGYHLLELVQMAAGETPKHRTDQRMKSVMRSLAPKLLWHTLRGGRFWIDEVAGEPVSHSQ